MAVLLLVLSLTRKLLLIFVHMLEQVLKLLVCLSIQLTANISCLSHGYLPLVVIILSNMLTIIIGYLNWIRQWPLPLLVCFGLYLELYFWGVIYEYKWYIHISLITDNFTISAESSHNNILANFIILACQRPVTHMPILVQVYIECHRESRPCPLTSRSRPSRSPTF